MATFLTTLVALLTGAFLATAHRTYGHEVATHRARPGRNARRAEVHVGGGGERDQPDGAAAGEPHRQHGAPSDTTDNTGRKGGNSAAEQHGAVGGYPISE